MWHQQPAFVMHRRPYRESSLLVSLLTPEVGRVDAVVRGVRGARPAQRARQAWLQPFLPLTVRWRERTGQGGLVTLSQFEPTGRVRLLSGEALACGLYLNELTLRALPDRLPVPMLFARYGTVIEALAQSESRAERSWLLRQYELTLLATLGVEPDWCRDAEGREIKTVQRYVWQPEQGLMPSVEGISGACIRKLAAGDFDRACLGGWKRLLRQMLRPWLGGRPLEASRLLERRPYETDLSGREH